MKTLRYARRRRGNDAPTPRFDALALVRDIGAQGFRALSFEVIAGSGRDLMFKLEVEAVDPGTRHELELFLKRKGFDVSGGSTGLEDGTSDITFSFRMDSDGNYLPLGMRRK